MHSPTIFPIRHHSPTASLLLAELIRERWPRLILVEGPSDANPLLDFITAPETEPPIALLAHARPRDDEPRRHLLYPLSAYSPEYVALREAHALEIAARFIDIPAAVAIGLDGPGVGPSDPSFDEAAGRMGWGSFEELWETAIENGGLDREGFLRAMLDYAGLLRSEAAPDPEWLLREAFMRQEIARALAEGYAAEEILIVCGAFHAPALADPGPAPAPRLPPPVPGCELTLIPYSYPRLAEQSGYGAGNRAPRWYQRVYDHGGDFDRAGLELMAAFLNQLRVEGHGASLADLIEAYRLARGLSRLREKRAPGLEEVGEALAACLLHGDHAQVRRRLEELAIGRAVGRVSARIGRGALHQEFYREVEQHRLPLSDRLQEFILHLTNPTEIGTSVFLHRLRLCAIPFARILGTVTGAQDYLSQTREKWEVQWTPAVDAALVERSLEGEGLEEVCGRALRARLREAATAGEAAEILLEVALAEVGGLLGEALTACDGLAAAERDFQSLARSCQNLQALVAYGASRALPPARLAEMLGRIFTRAALLLTAATRTDDDGVEGVCTGMRALHEICAHSAAVDRRLFYGRAVGLIDSDAAHPKAAGLAAAIAHLAREIDEAELLACFARRLSAGNTALDGALFLDGFLGLNKLVLVRSPAVVGLLDRFVQAIPEQELIPALPVLRRAFADLSRSELDYLAGHLLSLYRPAVAPSEETKVARPEGLEGIEAVSQALDDLF